MITEVEIIKETAKELDLDEDLVTHHLKAWIKGVKDRCRAEPLLHIEIAPGIRLYFNARKTYKDFRAFAKLNDKNYTQNLRNIHEEIKKIRQIKMIDATEKAKKRHSIYNQHVPIDYYGFKQGYSLQDLERIQSNVFDKYNKFEYKNKHGNTI